MARKGPARRPEVGIRALREQAATFVKRAQSGDHVVITGNPGRNPEDHRLRMRTIARPSDGWKWGGTFD